VVEVEELVYHPLLAVVEAVLVCRLLPALDRFVDQSWQN